MFSLIFRMIFLVTVFAAVAATAQETPVVSERDDSAQAQQETHEQQGAEDVAEGAPETFTPTEELSEDYPEDFPVDI